MCEHSRGLFLPKGTSLFRLSREILWPLSTNTFENDYIIQHFSFQASVFFMKWSGSLLQDSQESVADSRITIISSSNYGLLFSFHIKLQQFSDCSSVKILHYEVFLVLEFKIQLVFCICHPQSTFCPIRVSVVCIDFVLFQASSFC